MNKTERYTRAVNALESLLAWWFSLSEVEQASKTAISRPTPNSHSSHRPDPHPDPDPDPDPNPNPILTLIPILTLTLAPILSHLHLQADPHDRGRHCRGAEGLDLGRQEELGSGRRRGRPRRYLLTYSLAYLRTHSLTYLRTYSLYVYLRTYLGRPRRRGVGRRASRAGQVLVVAHDRRLPVAAEWRQEGRRLRPPAARGLEPWWGLCPCRPWLCRYQSISIDNDINR